MNPTIEAFGYPENLIKEYRHWVVLIRPEQVTVGSLVLAAKDNVARLGDLSSGAWAEFATVSKEMENLLAETFGAEKFNYLALMMVDPNPHFHFIPRYSKPVEIGGRQFVDRDWPKKTELNPIDLDNQTLDLITAKLRQGSRASGRGSY